MMKHPPFVAMLVLSGCLVPGPQDGLRSSPLSIELTGPRKAGDRIDVSDSGNPAFLDVHSEMGIGRATISPAQGDWPTRMIFRVHLKGLESFSVNNGKFTIATSVISRPPYRLICEVRPGDGSFVSEASPYWMPARIVPGNGSAPAIPLKGGYIEVALPRIVLESRPKHLYVQWVDFLR
jgi:hypothetical protein